LYNRPEAAAVPSGLSPTPIIIIIIIIIIIVATESRIVTLLEQRVKWFLALDGGEFHALAALIPVR
jgi:hypothetical protein